MDMGVFNLRWNQTKDFLSITIFRIKYFHWVLEFHFFTASKLCFKITCTKAWLKIIAHKIAFYSHFLCVEIKLF